MGRARLNPLSDPRGAHARAFEATLGAAPKGRLRVHRWYLRHAAPETVAVPPKPQGVETIRAHDCTVAFFRFLYDHVGEDWLWGERRLEDDETVARSLRTSHVDVLYERGTPAGFVQIEPRGTETEIAYVGLMPHATGRGFGTWMVADAMRRAAREHPGPQTINTCTLDSPGGLALYARLGFALEREIDFDWPDPRLSGVIRRDAAPHVPLAE